MDISEQIIRGWLEIQGFLVQSRIRYKVYSERSAGWSDIDMIGYRVKDHKRVAVDISAWMTEYITLSYVTKEDSNTYYRLDCTPMIGQIRLGESGGVRPYPPE
jgi:signal peptidase I